MENQKNSLKLKPIIRPKRRIARGRSGKGGKTAGRGIKGAKARSGKSIPSPSFEGGQTPLIQKLPKKKGFKTKVKFFKVIFNLDQIEKAFKAGEIVSYKTLVQKGLIEVPKTRNKKVVIKILGRGGRPSKSLKFEGCQFSKEAQKIISQ